MDALSSTNLSKLDEFNSLLSQVEKQDVQFPLFGGRRFCSDSKNYSFNELLVKFKEALPENPNFIEKKENKALLGRLIALNEKGNTQLQAQNGFKKLLTFIKSYISSFFFNRNAALDDLKVKCQLSIKDIGLQECIKKGLAKWKQAAACAASQPELKIDDPQLIQALGGLEKINRYPVLKEEEVTVTFAKSGDRVVESIVPKKPFSGIVRGTFEGKPFFCFSLLRKAGSKEEEYTEALILEKNGDWINLDGSNLLMNCQKLNKKDQVHGSLHVATAVVLDRLSRIASGVTVHPLQITETSVTETPQPNGEGNIGLTADN